jgi:hypothetical protein
MVKNYYKMMEQEGTLIVAGAALAVIILWLLVLCVFG